MQTFIEVTDAYHLSIWSLLGACRMKSNFQSMETNWSSPIFLDLTLQGGATHTKYNVNVSTVRYLMLMCI